MHHLAILLSRCLNTLNPNDQLASTVYSLSKHHSTLEQFHKAITSFGKFTLAQAQEVYDFCQAQDTLDKAFNNPNGLTVTDHDVLAPDAPVRAGLSTNSSDKHVFKQPASRASTLGLDRLAADKRRDKEAIERSDRVKRVKYDQLEEDPTSSGFKSQSAVNPLSSRPSSLTEAPCSPRSLSLSSSNTSISTYKPTQQT